MWLQTLQSKDTKMEGGDEILNGLPALPPLEEEEAALVPAPAMGPYMLDDLNVKKRKKDGLRRRKGRKGPHGEHDAADDDDGGDLQDEPEKKIVKKPAARLPSDGSLALYAGFPSRTQRLDSRIDALIVITYLS